jgi:hypothetical protein
MPGMEFDVLIIDQKRMQTGFRLKDQRVFIIATADKEPTADS